MEGIIHSLRGLSPELIILILAMLPISELRGAIPVGLAMGVGLPQTVAIAIIGNLIPVPLLLLFLEPVSRALRRFRPWRRFFEWLFERTKKRAEVVERYEALGLALFVAIPLPVTGAWTGSVAASLFKIRFRYAFASIILGVLMAACVVTLICLGGREIWLSIQPQ